MLTRDTSNDLELARSVNARKGSFYTDETIHEIRSRFLNNETILSIASAMRISDTTVYRYVDDLFSVVGRRPRRPRQTIIDRQDMIESMAQGHSNAAIAKSYGMTRQSITMYLKRNPLTDAEQVFINNGLQTLGKKPKV